MKPVRVFLIPQSGLRLHKLAPLFHFTKVKGKGLCEYEQLKYVFYK